MANILGKVFMTPKDEWVLTKKYEKLDIVTVTNSTSVSAYIAKDDISENTQITDSKWMKLFTVTNGKNGTNGADGTDGAKGDAGKAATIAVGSVTSGSVAKVTNSGNTNAAVFDFVLPKGDTGAKGDKGSPGANVRTSSKTITEGTNLRADVNGSVNVGDTVIDVNGDVYTVTDKDDTNFTASKKVTSIKGIKGDKGDAGAKGATGAAGAKGDKGDPGTTGAKGASVKSITLTKDAGGAITGGTATLTDNTTITITVTTAGA